MSLTEPRSWKTKDTIDAESLNKLEQRSFTTSTVNESDNLINLNTIKFNTIIQKTTSGKVYSSTSSDPENEEPIDANNDFPYKDQKLGCVIINYKVTSTGSLCFQLVFFHNGEAFFRTQTTSGWKNWRTLENIPLFKVTSYLDLNSVSETSTNFLATMGVYPNFPGLGRASGHLVTDIQKNSAGNKIYGLQFFYQNFAPQKVYYRSAYNNITDENSLPNWENWYTLNAHYTSIDPAAALFFKEKLFMCYKKWKSLVSSSEPNGRSSMSSTLSTKENGIPYLDYPSKALVYYNTHTDGNNNVYPPEGALYWGRLRNDLLIKGLPYSGVFCQDGDILLNRNLATFFSAINNPYSILYQGAIEEPTLNKNNRRASKYGVVCSTFGSALAGLPIYFTSTGLFQVAKTLNPPVPKKLSELKIGMLRVATAHTQVITDIFYDDEGNGFLELSESIKPFTKTTIKPFEEVQADWRLGLNTLAPSSDVEDEDSPSAIDPQAEQVESSATYTPEPYLCLDPIEVIKYKENQLSEEEAKTYLNKDLVDLDDYATDVITEYGNNTWFLLHNDDNSGRQPINLYIPSAKDNMTLYYGKKINGTISWQSTVLLASNNDVDNAKEGKYNIAEKLNECGIWYVTTNTGNATYAIINIIDFGEAFYNNDNHTVTVRNFQNLVPVGWKKFKCTNSNADKGDGTYKYGLFDAQNYKIEYQHEDGFLSSSDIENSSITFESGELTAISTATKQKDKTFIRVYFEVRENENSTRYGSSFIEVYANNDINNTAKRTRVYL